MKPPSHFSTTARSALSMFCRLVLLILFCITASCSLVVSLLSSIIHRQNRMSRPAADLSQIFFSLFPFPIFPGAVATPSHRQRRKKGGFPLTPPSGALDPLRPRPMVGSASSFFSGSGCASGPPKVPPKIPPRNCKKNQPRDSASPSDERSARQTFFVPSSPLFLRNSFRKFPIP